MFRPYRVGKYIDSILDGLMVKEKEVIALHQSELITTCIPFLCQGCTFVIFTFITCFQ